MAHFAHRTDKSIFNEHKKQHIYAHLIFIVCGVELIDFINNANKHDFIVCTTFAAVRIASNNTHRLAAPVCVINQLRVRSARRDTAAQHTHRLRDASHAYMQFQNYSKKKTFLRGARV